MDKKKAFKKVTMLFPASVHKKLKLAGFEAEKTMTDIVLSLVNGYLDGNTQADPAEVKNTSLSVKKTILKEPSEPVFKLVDVKSIKIDIVKNYSLTVSRALDEFSRSIVKIGLLRPVILRQINIDEYQLLSNVDEFEAVVRANKENPKKCEMVNAFVVPEIWVEEAKKQISKYAFRAVSF
ncbi:MAG: hypothetical protein HQM08_29230 [Candidatus Riflebacteria bacterium]|nr:hypothetical protein [Candidatus Riflebacteria bacterium]